MSYFCFLPPDPKPSTIKAFPEINLVLLNLRAGTVFPRIPMFFLSPNAKWSTTEDLTERGLVLLTRRAHPGY